MLPTLSSGASALTPLKKCKYGSKCGQKKTCPYAHPSSATAGGSTGIADDIMNEVVKCRYGSRCRNKHCKYIHPPRGSTGTGTGLHDQTQSDSQELHENKKRRFFYTIDHEGYHTSKIPLLGDPNSLHALLIGPRGSKHRELELKCGCKLHLRGGKFHPLPTRGSGVGGSGSSSNKEDAEGMCVLVRSKSGPGLERGMDVMREVLKEGGAFLEDRETPDEEEREEDEKDEVKINVERAINNDADGDAINSHEDMASNNNLLTNDSSDHNIVSTAVGTPLATSPPLPSISNDNAINFVENNPSILSRNDETNLFFGPCNSSAVPLPPISSTISLTNGSVRPTVTAPNNGTSITKASSNTFAATNGVANNNVGKAIFDTLQNDRKMFITHSVATPTPQHDTNGYHHDVSRTNRRPLYERALSTEIYNSSNNTNEGTSLLSRHSSTPDAASVIMRPPPGLEFINSGESTNFNAAAAFVTSSMASVTSNTSSLSHIQQQDDMPIENFVMGLLDEIDEIDRDSINEHHSTTSTPIFAPNTAYDNHINHQNPHEQHNLQQHQVTSQHHQFYNYSYHEQELLQKQHHQQLQQRQQHLLHQQHGGMLRLENAVTSYNLRCAFVQWKDLWMRDTLRKADIRKAFDILTTMINRRFLSASLQFWHYLLQLEKKRSNAIHNLNIRSHNRERKRQLTHALDLWKEWNTVRTEEAKRAETARAQLELRKSLEGARKRKSEKKTKRHAKWMEEQVRLEQERAELWGKEIKNEIATVQMLVDLMAAEFVRQNIGVMVARVADLSVASVKRNEEAMEKLIAEGRLTYRILHCELEYSCSRVKIAGLSKELNERSGTIQHWDAMKEKYCVGLDTKRGKNVEVRFIKPGHLEILSQATEKRKGGSSSGHGNGGSPSRTYAVAIKSLFLNLDLDEFIVSLEIVQIMKKVESLDTYLKALMDQRDDDERARKWWENEEKRRDEEARRRRAERKARENAAWEEEKKRYDEQKRRYQEWRREQRKQNKKNVHSSNGPYAGTTGGPQGGRPKCTCPECFITREFFGSFFGSGFSYGGDGDEDSDYDEWDDEWSRRQNSKRQAQKEDEDKNQSTILGVAPSASAQEIKSVYRKKALMFHPDKYKPELGMTKDESTEHFKKLTNAYDHLMSNYDE
eukprot:CAMPEP_0194358316 /NCGR_PEP_ID=MMETSP0174-20130528/5565_1 /TAXON_ID=216777 /ORGANISM="Proboscia alata, Strain PI-D3" /LENGTH=1149 /DNA_ID=CAMNT_0039128593 /DNA_START=667 /DNA_END=4116 /DNA_ORIENTATION=-